MRRIAALFAAGLITMAACGGDDDNDPTGPGGGGTTTLQNGTYSGTINGSTYRPAVMTFTANSGLVVFSTSDAQGRAFAFAVSATSTGTYQIGESEVGNNALWVEGQSSWWAYGSVGSGSVTLTTLTANHAVGSYTFSMPANPGTPATGTRNATGSFDITF